MVMSPAQPARSVSAPWRRLLLLLALTFGLSLGSAWAGAFLSTGNLNVARSGHTTVKLADGRVLVAGGGAGTTAFSSAEIYEPATGKWTVTGSMNAARFNPRSVRLADGRVLVVQGSVSPQDGAVLMSAEIYNPADGTWSMTGAPATSGAQALTLLPNGKVLMVANHPNGEVYDPADGTWHLAGAFVTRRSGGARATLLPNGLVLVFGGPYSNASTNSELFDPANETFTATGSYSGERSLFASAQLANGEVLIAGGQGAFVNGVAPYFTSAEIYNPTDGTWRAAGSLRQNRVSGSATLLADGRVLITGGSGRVNNIGASVARAEIYDPQADAWSLASPMNLPRSGGGTRLDDGRVLISGGLVSTAIADAELYDPAAPSLDVVSIASNHPGNPALAWPGDTVTLSFTASGPIMPPAVVLVGEIRGAIKGAGETWSTSVVVPPGAADGPVAFRIAYQSPGFIPSDVTSTTDQSTVSVDGLTQPPTTTVANATLNSTTLSLPFTLPEPALPGSVKITVTPFTGDGAGSVLVLAADQEVAGPRTLVFQTTNPTASPSIVSGAPFSTGNYRFEISYRDAAGNAAATKVIDLLRIDAEAPVITSATMTPWARPGGWIYVTLKANDSDVVFAQGTIAGQSVTETIGGGSTAFVGIVVPQNTGDGPFGFSLSVKDRVGNTSTVVDTPTDGIYTRIDRLAPEVTVPADITVEAVSFNGAPAAYEVSATDDLDPAPRIQVSHSSGSTFHRGENTVQVSAVDHAGNETVRTFKVTVVDTTKPTASVPAVIQLLAGPTGVTMLGDLTARVVRSDAVGIASVVQSLPESTNLSLGEYPISFDVSDLAGNHQIVQSTVKVAFPAPSAMGDVTVVQRSGMALFTPDVPEGTTIESFGPPALNDFRTLAARVVLNIDQQKRPGIYVTDGDSVISVPAYRGSVVPGINALPNEPEGMAAFKSFLDPILDARGAVAFVATLSGVKAGVNQGVWSNALISNHNPDGSLELVLREGSDVPGLPTGTRLKSVTSIAFQGDRILALVKLAPARGLVAAGKDDVALVALSGGDDGIEGALLLRTNQTIDNLPIKTIATLAPALGSPGQGRWVSEEKVLAKVTLTTGEVRLVQLPLQGAPVSLLSTAESPAIIDANTRWKTFGVPATDSTAAHFAVKATVAPQKGGVTASEDTALLSKTASTGWSVLAREGGLTPISADPDGPRYAGFFDPVVNDQGQFAFLATLRGKGIKAKNGTGLICGKTGHFLVGARLGDPLPDANGNPTTAVWTKLISHALTSGEHPSLVFLAETSSSGDIAAKYKLALWSIDADGQLHRLLRTGKPLGLDGPIVTGLQLLTATPGAYGIARSYNETGSLTVLATFADKTQAILRVDVP